MMKSFFASIYKDICLFLSASGILSLLLPALAALLMLAGSNDTAAADLSVKPFAVAVYDLDETLMSRSLISQFKEIDLFSNVKVYTSEDITSGAFDTIDTEENGNIKRSDALFSVDAFKDCAAIITIPTDFFYDLYTEDETRVRLYTNEKMAVESRITENIISGVARIIAGERAAWSAAYTERYGENFHEDGELLDAYLDSAAASIIEGALGRRSVLYDGESMAQIESNVKNTFFAAAAIMLFFLVSLGVVKTMPDERRMGLFDRFVSIGGNVIELILSKLVSGAVFCSAGIVPLILILRPELGGAGMLPLLALIFAFLSCFFVVLAFGFITGNTEQFMLAGGMATALSLLFGGAIYPFALLPEYAKKIGAVSNAKHLINALSNKSGIMLSSIVPLALIITIAVTVSFIAFLLGTQRRGKRLVKRSGV
ncbi:MAG: ABC transporter permease [Clostridia bacterium]|nr:ABC transporter permease [Clostridia bacterium]